MIRQLYTVSSLLSPTPITDSHEMIAYYMILANSMTGTWLHEVSPLSPIYRIHTSHEIEDIQSTESIESTKLNTQLQDIPTSVYTVLSRHWNEDSSETAYYCFQESDESPIYHAGLHKHFYVHCTSPIRRLPDVYNQLLIHQLLSTVSSSKSISLPTNSLEIWKQSITSQTLSQWNQFQTRLHHYESALHKLSWIQSTTSATPTTSTTSITPIIYDAYVIRIFDSYVRLYVPILSFSFTTSIIPKQLQSIMSVSAQGVVTCSQQIICTFKPGQQVRIQIFKIPSRIQWNRRFECQWIVPSLNNTE